jgi:hypothetical protein
LPALQQGANGHSLSQMPIGSSVCEVFNQVVTPVP